MSYFINNDLGKNQYHHLNDSSPYSRGSTRSFFASIIVGLTLALLILSLWNIKQQHVRNHNAVVLDASQSLLHTVSKNFLSFGLDTSLLRDKKSFPIEDPAFINLAKHLSPAYVRIGGTSADCLYFDEEVQSNPEAKSPVDDQDISNFTINSDKFIAIGEFVRKSRLRMLFDLNDLIRNPDWTWNNSNAREIIKFAKAYDLDVDWQLANEPNSFRHVFGIEISGKQLAHDYVKLRSILNDEGFETSLLVGPEVNHIGQEQQVQRFGEEYAKEFLKHEKRTIDYFTWHQYYLNGREAEVSDFLRPEVFNTLPSAIASLKETINSSGRQVQMWMTETSSAFGGGAPNLSDRFVAGFLWLDKLGYAASQGVQVVIRQSLFGNHYAMVGADLQPNPDWWVSVAFKQLVSQKVLQLQTRNNFGKLRLYAHCTPEDVWIGRVPAVTIYGVNIDRDPVTFSILGVHSNCSKCNVKIFLYVLTSDDLQSRKIKMNGEELILKADGKLPPFYPKIMEFKEKITIPGYSMVFAVVHGANVAACAA